MITYKELHLALDITHHLYDMELMYDGLRIKSLLAICNNDLAAFTVQELNGNSHTAIDEIPDSILEAYHLMMHLDTNENQWREITEDKLMSIHDQIFKNLEIMQKKQNMPPIQEMQIKAAMRIQTELEHICNDHHFSMKLRLQALEDLAVVNTELASYGLFYALETHEDGTVNIVFGLDEGI